MINLRPATVVDVPLILRFIRDLGAYEKMSDEVVVTEDDLRKTLFDGTPKAHVVIGEVDGKAQGFALYFYNYSTFVGRAGLYLEDLFVTKESRGQGLGKALILHLAEIAAKEGCGRMEWAVLNWNAPSIEFYKSLGAKPLEDWTGYRLDHKALGALTNL